MFLYDIPNVLAVLIILFVTYRMCLIPTWLFFFLGLFAFTPFILNDVLFSARYMPDQFQYFSMVQKLRHLDFNFVTNQKLWVSTWMLAITPLPYVETIKSLGFFNRLIASSIIIWLYAYKKLRGWPLLLILFYPSFLLYSSLSLRDILVFMFMIMSVIFFLENRRLTALFVAAPLFIIKFQNFFLIIVFFVIHLSFTKGSIFFKYKYLFITCIFITLAPYIMSIIELLNYYRLALYVEDGGLNNSYVAINSLTDFTITAFQSGPYFLLKPFPWEAGNIFQMVQSFENIFISCFLIWLFLKTSKIDKGIAIKWLVYIVIAMSIYGLVIYNFGTAARYRFSFILIVVIGMTYELYLKHGHLILNKRARS
jgi:hypothetical protein